MIHTSAVLVVSGVMRRNSMLQPEVVVVHGSAMHCRPRRGAPWLIWKAVGVPHLAPRGLRCLFLETKPVDGCHMFGTSHASKLLLVLILDCALFGSTFAPWAWNPPKVMHAAAGTSRKLFRCQEPRRLLQLLEVDQEELEPGGQSN